MAGQYPISVTNRLIEMYGLEARPGAKTTCPFCQRKTLFVKKDDTLAKCFHPLCGAFISGYTRRDERRSHLDKLLIEIHTDFHRALLSQSGENGDCAYDYLVNERGIHPKVVEDSMLGVVPEDYSLDIKFIPTIREAEEAIEKAKPEGGTSGRQNSNAFSKAEEDLNLLTGAKEKLENCINGNSGWLAFFLTNQYHQIVGIRLRKPYTKQIVFFKPYEAVSGVFGHGMFRPSPDRAEFDDLILVVEGEFNQLQLQSLVLRHGEAIGQKLNYVNCCAVGGAQSADIQVVQAISTAPVICYDNDSSGAGYKLVEIASKAISVSKMTTPETDSDLDSHIISFGQDHQAAWEAVKKLIADRKKIYKDIASVADEISEIRSKRSPKDRRKEFEIFAEVAQRVINDLQERGTFYRDDFEPYCFLDDLKQLIKLDPENVSFEVQMSNYGLNSSERIYKYVVHELLTHTLKHGERINVYRFVHYKADSNVLYMPNYADQIYRISIGGIDLVDNGTDGVLFVSDSRYQPLEMVNGIGQDDRSVLFETLIQSINYDCQNLSDGECACAVLFWLLSMCFPELLPTKPILAFIGEKGSGKSMTLRLVGKVLFGKSFDVTPLPNKADDFDAAVTNAPFVALDNADSKCEWLEDRLATVATGGVIKRRKLYSNNTLVEIPSRCNLAITARTPRFRRDDVSDRLLIVRVERIETFRSERSIIEHMMNNRDRIYTELMLVLKDVLAALEATREETFEVDFRMADFGEFCLRLASHLGLADECRELLTKIVREQTEFTLEGEPFVDQLIKWTEQNEMTWVDAQQLSDGMAELSGDKRYSYGSKSIGQRLKNLKHELSHDIEIYERPARANRKEYAFRLKHEPFS